MIHWVVNFISIVASQEQATYLDYVLVLCSNFKRAVRKELHLARNPEPDSMSDTQPDVICPQGHVLTRNDYVPTNSFPAFTNNPQPAENYGSNIQYSRIMSTDQGIYNTGLLSAPPWNWQDIIAYFPPVYNFGAYDLDESSL
jgi:hypothetical protein